MKLKEIEGGTWRIEYDSKEECNTVKEILNKNGEGAVPWQIECESHDCIVVFTDLTYCEHNKEEFDDLRLIKASDFLTSNKM